MEEKRKKQRETPDDTQLETTERRLGPMGSETIGQAFDPASFEHVPVLLNECLDGLAIDPAGIYLDVSDCHSVFFLVGGFSLSTVCRNLQHLHDSLSGDRYEMLRMLSDAIKGGVCFGLFP